MLPMRDSFADRRKAERRVFLHLGAMSERRKGDRRNRATQQAAAPPDHLLAIYRPDAAAEGNHVQPEPGLRLHRTGEADQRRDEGEEPHLLPFPPPAPPPTAEELRECLGEFYPQLWRILSRTFEQDIVEEAVGEAIAEAMNFIASGKAAIHPNRRAWLIRVARNEALTCIKKRSLLRVTRLTREDLVVSAEENLSDLRQKELLLLAMEELPPDDRAMIEETAFGRVSGRKYAERLEIPPSTFRRRHARVLGELRGIMEHLSD